MNTDTADNLLAALTKTENIVWQQYHAIREELEKRPFSFDLVLLRSAIQIWNHEGLLMHWHGADLKNNQAIVRLSGKTQFLSMGNLGLIPMAELLRRLAYIDFQFLPDKTQLMAAIDDRIKSTTT